MKLGKCLALAALFACSSVMAAEPEWIDIVITPSTPVENTTGSDLSSVVELETRTKAVDGSLDTPVEARVKTWDISNFIFLNTTKFRGLFMILR